MTQILGDYQDKDGSASRKILEKSTSKKQKKASSDSDATAHDSDSDDDEEEGGVNKGPSLCSVDQSAITGESLAVDKYVGDVAYYTCGVKRGKCYGVVSVPAKESFVGRTASLVSSELSCRWTSVGMLTNEKGSNDVGHFQIVLSGIGLSYVPPITHSPMIPG
jgi:H+-transporting ATPase